MKFTLSFKTPDVSDQLKNEHPEMSKDDERKAKALIKKYVEYDEYIYVEFDTENQTVTALPIK